MTIHAAGGASDRSDFEVTNRMIDHLKVGFKIGIVDLLEEQIQLSFDLFG